MTAAWLVAATGSRRSAGLFHAACADTVGLPRHPQLREPLGGSA